MLTLFKFLIEKKMFKLWNEFKLLLNKKLLRETAVRDKL